MTVQDGVTARSNASRYRCEASAHSREGEVIERVIGVIGCAREVTTRAERPLSVVRIIGLLKSKPRSAGWCSNGQASAIVRLMIRACPKCGSLFSRQLEYCGFDGAKLTGLEALNGRVIAGYRVLAPIGSGASGTVFRAMDLDRKRIVALKLLHAAAVSTEVGMIRFTREAEAIRMIRHPSVMSIYDYGRDGNLHYIAMELLTGRTLLDELAENGSLPPQRLVAIAGCIAEALAMVHSSGLIHRDLKPANVMLCPAEGRETVKLLDFGIVHFVESEERLTRTGAVVGTPLYMAPEQVLRGAIGPATDLYALGAIMFEMASGRTLFSGELNEILGRQVHQQAPELPELNGLGKLVASMLSKAPSDRPQTAAIVLAELERIRSRMRDTTVLRPLDVEPTVWTQSPLTDKRGSALDRRTTKLILAAIGGSAAALALLAIVSFQGDKGSRQLLARATTVAGPIPEASHVEQASVPVPALPVDAAPPPAAPDESKASKSAPAPVESAAAESRASHRRTARARPSKEAPSSDRSHVEPAKADDADSSEVMRKLELLNEEIERAELQIGREQSKRFYSQWLELATPATKDLDSSHRAILLRQIEALRAEVAKAASK
jgi:serine/threonine-protein kinase